MFLYSEHDYHDTAYFIRPVKGAETIIKHQYDCNCCKQLEIEGHITVVPEPTASIIKALLGGCNVSDAETIEKCSGLPIKEVLGEGLALLRDGRYVATENCD